MEWIVFVSVNNTKQTTPFKMGMVMDFNTCKYGDSLEGLELMSTTPKKLILKIPRGRLKEITFLRIFT